MLRHCELPYHDEEHAIQVSFEVEEILDEEGATHNDRQLARVASFFHDVGHLYDTSERDHEEMGSEIAFQVMKPLGFTQEEMFTVENAIESTRVPHEETGDIVSDALQDADTWNLGAEYDIFIERSRDAFEEWKLRRDKPAWTEDNTFEEWMAMRVPDLFEATEPITEYAQEKYGPGREENIRRAIEEYDL